VHTKGSITTYGVGGFTNARVVGPVLVSVGANYTRVDDFHEEPATFTMSEPYENSAISARLRLMYLF
jgi:hypothetical protein